MAKWAEWFEINLCDDRNIMAMVEAAARWCMAVKSGDAPRWLVLLGSSGIGKTLICNRVWRWLKTRPDFRFEGDYDPVKLYWPQFAQKLRSGEAYGIRNASMQWPYTFLDDICAENVSNYSSEELNTILGARVDKWTIITSNKLMEDIDALDRRIASRFIRSDSELVQAITDDYNTREGVR
jgi:DNA replication protein DnaC